MVDELLAGAPLLALRGPAAKRRRARAARGRPPGCTRRHRRSTRRRDPGVFSVLDDGHGISVLRAFRPSESTRQPRTRKPGGRKSRFERPAKCALLVRKSRRNRELGFLRLAERIRARRWPPRAACSLGRRRAQAACRERGLAASSARKRSDSSRLPPCALLELELGEDRAPVFARSAASALQRATSSGTRSPACRRSAGRRAAARPCRSSGSPGAGRRRRSGPAPEPVELRAEPEGDRAARVGAVAADAEAQVLPLAHGREVAELAARREQRHVRIAEPERRELRELLAELEREPRPGVRRRRPCVMRRRSSSVSAASAAAPKASANASIRSGAIERPAAARWPPKRSRWAEHAPSAPCRSKAGIERPEPFQAPSPPATRTTGR